MEAIFAEANEAHVAEDYELAASLYDQAIAGQADRPTWYAARAQNSLKLTRYAAALADAQKGLELDRTSATLHKCKGTALFYLDSFIDAKESFVEAKRLGNKQCDLWIRKCDAEIGHAVAPSTATATPAAATTAATPTSTPAPSTATTTATHTPAPSTLATTPAVPLASKMTQQWFQTAADVTITLFCKNMVRDNITVRVDEQDGSQVSTRIVLPDSSIFERSWLLFAAVTTEPRLVLNAYRLEIVLTKAQAGVEWKGLEAAVRTQLEGVQLRPNVVRSEVAATVYPSSSKKHVDFNELDRVGAKAEEEDKPQGEAALHALFKSIYKSADEDTRRAMIKSYQTSGGTVLSCNWKEVEKTDYEKDRQGPKGTEFREWNS